MKSILILAALLVSGVAFAQQPPQPPVTIPGPLAQAILAHLSGGGTYQAGAELARELIDAANAPQRDAMKEAEIRKRIEDEAKAKVAPTTEAPK